MYGSCSASAREARDVAESCSQTPSTRSQRSGRSIKHATMTSALAGVIPASPSSFVDSRAGTPPPRRPRAFLACVLQDLAQQARAVLHRAAVGIGAVVIPRRQEVMQHAQVVPGVDVDEVVSRLARARRPPCDANGAGRAMSDVAIMRAPAPGQSARSRPADAPVPSAVPGSTGWARSSRCAPARYRQGRRAGVNRVGDAGKARECRSSSHKRSSMYGVMSRSGGSRPARCTPPPSRPRL